MLLIDGDGAARTVASVLQEKGYDVRTYEEAQAGFRAACDEPPDCIVCNPDLPDIDGIWVVRRIRTESGRVSSVPFIFLGDGDTETRQQSLRVGVDVFLTRPISDEEVASQVTALIGMAARFDEEAPPSSLTNAAAIRGDLSAFPLASLLMMFEMERRSGIVTVHALDGKRASMTLTSGLFSATEVNGAPRGTLEVLRLVLSWRAGRFSFTPRETNTLPPPRGSVGALVLEAMRLDDEEKHHGSPPSEPEVGSDDFLEIESQRGAVRISQLPPKRQ